MKNFKTITLTALACLLLECSCEKTQSLTELPPITQTGAKTFGCYVNGELFVPMGRIWSPQAPENPTVYFGTIRYNKPGFYWIRTQMFNEDNNKWFELEIYQVFEEKEYRFETDSIHIEYFDDFKHCYYSNYSEYFEKYNDTGYIHITKLDTIRGIISGTFAFTLTNIPYVDDTAATCDSVIRITDGRFDLKFDTKK